MSLYALFILLPLADLALLLFVADLIGGWTTLALVVVTGIAGATLARVQGLRAIESVQRDLTEARMPADSILSGLMVLAGAVLLLTPGVVTDLLGFLLLMPFVRSLIVPLIRGRVLRAVQAKMQTPQSYGAGPVIDVEAVPSAPDASGVVEAPERRGPG